MDKRVEWIYENSEDNAYRYVLGVKGKKPLLCIGINPSTAEPNKLDPTLKSVSRIAKNNGYDGWIMINLYPQRATDPNNMDLVINDEVKSINCEKIEKIISQYKIKDIWVAWGTIITKRKFLKECLLDVSKIINKLNCKWICFGKCSKDGHPHHPLYLKTDSSKELFDMEKYIEILH